MKAAKERKSPTSAKPNVTPFFNQSGEQSFFAQESTTDAFFNIQPKLSIGQANDQYEREADSMADKVVNSPVGQTTSLGIQKKCSDCENEDVQTKPLYESITPLVQKMEMEEEESLQMKSNASSDSTISSNFESDLKSSSGSGSSLSGDTKQEMESSFGADFSNVRIHNDSTAANLSSNINAQAFTHGNDIYFNRGKFAPSTPSGKHLLAHELTHTIQQGASIKRKPSDVIQAKCGDADCSTVDPLTPPCPSPFTFKSNPKLEAIRQSVFEAASNYEILERGDLGEEVELIQLLLLNTHCTGYNRINLRDELSRKEFGRETDRAIRQFQSGRNGANGKALSVDGDVGPGTLSAMDIELNLAPVSPAKPPEGTGNCFGKAKHGSGESQALKPSDVLPIFPFLPAFKIWEISNFDIDKHFLKTEHREFIRSQVIPDINDAKSKYPSAAGLHLRIIGEASTSGGNVHNWDLSGRRSDCTSQTLVAEGVDSSTIQTPLTSTGEELARIRREISGAPVTDGVEDRTARKVTIVLDLSSKEEEDCTETDMMLPSTKYFAKITCAGANSFNINIGNFGNPAQPVYREFLWTPLVPLFDGCHFKIPVAPAVFRPVIASTELQLATKTPAKSNAPSSFQGRVKLFSDLTIGEFSKTTGASGSSPFSIITPGEWNSIPCLNDHQDTDGFLSPIGPVKCGVVPAPPVVDNCYPSQEDCPPETRQAAGKEFVAHMIRISGDPLDAIKLIKKVAKAASIIDWILNTLGINALLGGAIITIGSKDLETPIMRPFIFGGGGFGGSGADSVNFSVMASKKFTLESPKQLEKSSAGLFLQDSDFEGGAKIKILGGTNKEQLTIDGNGVSKTIDLWGILCDGGSSRTASGWMKPITNAKCANLPVLPTLDINCKDGCSDSLKLSEFNTFRIKTGRAAFSQIPLLGKRLANEMGNCGATLAFINIGHEPDEGGTEIYRKFLFIGKNDPCKYTIEKSSFSKSFLDPKALAYQDPNDITAFSDFAGFAKVDATSMLKMRDLPPTNYVLPGEYEENCQGGNLKGVVIPLSPVECGTTPAPSHSTVIDPGANQKCLDFKTDHLALVNGHVAKLNGTYKDTLDSIPSGPALRYPIDSYRDLFSQVGLVVTHGVFVGKTIGNIPVVTFITFKVNGGRRLPSGYYVFEITVLNEPCSFDEFGNPTLILPVDCNEGFIPEETIIFPIPERKKPKQQDQDGTQFASNQSTRDEVENEVPDVQTKSQHSEEKVDQTFDQNPQIQNQSNNHIQRRALPNVVQQPIANYEIDLPQPETPTMSGDVIAEQELSLSLEDQGTFEGFDEESTAQNVSGQNINHINAIIEDDQSKFHVFQTNLSPFEADFDYQIIPLERSSHVENMYFENQLHGSSESDPDHWVDRVRTAVAMRDDDNLMEASLLFTQLVAEATGTNASDYHIAAQPLDYVSGLNFSIHMTGAFGRGGLRNLPTDRTSEIPRNVLVIGAGVFNRNSPDDVRATFYHELTHYTQAQRAIDLLQNWRQTDTQLSFSAWLDVQSRTGQITSLEHSLTIGFIHNDDDNTETTAHLNAFINSYPNADISLPDHLVFRSLSSMTLYWLGADRSLQAVALSRIISFYQTLPEAWQDRLADYVSDQSNNHPNLHQRIPFRRLDSQIND